MVPLLIDHDLTKVIVDGVRTRCPSVDLVLAMDVGLARASDAELLEWAATRGRVLVSHDQRTMTAAAYERLRSGRTIAGLVIVPQTLEFRVAIEELSLIAYCSEPDEWLNTVRFLPL